MLKANVHGWCMTAYSAPRLGVREVACVASARPDGTGAFGLGAETMSVLPSVSQGIRLGDGWRRDTLACRHALEVEADTGRERNEFTVSCELEIAPNILVLRQFEIHADPV